MRHFTADWHFGHSNIIGYTDRSHANVDNMDDHFTRELQEELSEDDELWCLGDMTGPKTKMYNLRCQLSKIPCEVHWIQGNHDLDDPSDIDDLAEFHGDRVELSLDQENEQGYPIKLVLDHYPMASWNGRYHGAIQLHGHVHGRFDNSGVRRADVGVDTPTWEQSYGSIPQDKILEELLTIPAPKHRD